MNNTMLNMINEEIEEVNRCFEAYGQDVFDRVYKLKVRHLNEFMAHMTNNLYMVKSLGFISEDERKELDKEMRKTIELALAKNRKTQIERIGEYEFDIQWLMNDQGHTREEAIAKYEWLTSLEQDSVLKGCMATETPYFYGRIDNL